MTEITDVEKNEASEWFLSLRNDIISAFEKIEQSHFEGPFSDNAPGKFEVKETKPVSYTHLTLPTKRIV